MELGGNAVSCGRNRCPLGSPRAQCHRERRQRQAGPRGTWDGAVAGMPRQTFSLGGCEGRGTPSVRSTDGAFGVRLVSGEEPRLTSILLGRRALLAGLASGPEDSPWLCRKLPFGLRASGWLKGVGGSQIDRAGLIRDTTLSLGPPGQTQGSELVGPGDVHHKLPAPTISRQTRQGECIRSKVADAV